ncbi:hypothetical protein LguiA_000249 [Lonicera macranthoides]
MLKNLVACQRCELVLAKGIRGPILDQEHLQQSTKTLVSYRESIAIDWRQIDHLYKTGHPRHSAAIIMFLGKDALLPRFKGYNRLSANNKEKFNIYATDANIADQSFNSNGQGTEQRFTTYAGLGYAGTEVFKNYANEGLDTSNDLSAYSKDSNITTSTFSSYECDISEETETFTFYSNSTNNPENKFMNYGADDKGAKETFTNYRNGANECDDTLQSYSNKGFAKEVNFINYQKIINQGSDMFKGYGSDGSIAQEVGFKVYDITNTFKEYAKDGITFKQYINNTISSASTDQLTTMAISEKKVYEADILYSKSKTKINHDLAICHVDTLTWRSTHIAFVTLCSGPDGFRPASPVDVSHLSILLPSYGSCLLCTTLFRLL